MGKKSAKSRQRWKRGIQAGCLALGMATAWGGEASGSVYLNVSLDAEQTITNAYIYYGVGYSSTRLQSLGTINAGASTLSIELPDNTVYRNYYVLVGLYDDEGTTGVAISFSSDDPIEASASWDDIFTSTNGYIGFSESEFVDLIYAQGGWSGHYLASERLASFLAFYGDASWGSSNTPCATLFGETATLVCFSNASYGGSVTIDLDSEPLQSATVPEPATSILFVGLIGSMLFWRRDWIHS
jgi:hypothetical protein